jgi:hypothetical protein
MNWIRTYPPGRPGQWHGRNYVIDHATRWVHMDRDYLPVLAGVADDTVLLEWDIAVSLEDRQTFARHIAREPDRIQVAPYLLYPASTSLPRPVWAHRRITELGDAQWVDDDEPGCDLFGFGMVYLPLDLVTAYLATCPAGSNDNDFSRWHHDTVGERVPIRWDCYPIHLHY